MSYLDYVKAANKFDKGLNERITDFAPHLMHFGKVKCDLCGEYSDVTEPSTEICTVTEAATGKKRYYHFCYDCLHRKMDIDDIQGTFTTDETKTWRLKYKEAKSKPPVNNVLDMCLNCFLRSHDIQAFERTENVQNDEKYDTYRRYHPAFIRVSEGMDSAVMTSPIGEVRSIYEYHYVLSLQPCKPGSSLALCDGKNKIICDVCPYKRKER